MSAATDFDISEKNIKPDKSAHDQQHPNMFGRLLAYVGSFGSSSTPPASEPMPKPNETSANNLDESSLPTKSDTEITKTRLLMRADQVIALTDGVSEPIEAENVKAEVKLLI